MMDQAAIDMLVYYSAAFFLMGYAVGVVLKVLTGSIGERGWFQMKAKAYGLYIALASLLLEAASAMAQVFPVDTATTTTITSVKADIVAWGVVFIGVALTVFAYRRIKALVRWGWRLRESAPSGSPWIVKGKIMLLRTVATDLATLGASLSADIVIWGGVAISLGLVASAVIWVMRMMRAWSECCATCF
jgi:hypothetical protein